MGRHKAVECENELKESRSVYILAESDRRLLAKEGAGEHRTDAGPTEGEKTLDCGRAGDGAFVELALEGGLMLIISGGDRERSELDLSVLGDRARCLMRDTISGAPLHSVDSQTDLSQMGETSVRLGAVATGMER